METPTRKRRTKEERYYVSDDEADLIERAAIARDMSKSDYVRRIVVPRATRDIQAKTAA